MFRDHWLDMQINVSNDGHLAFLLDYQKGVNCEHSVVSCNSSNTKRIAGCNTSVMRKLE
jgi:hypothetical protein